MCPKKGCPESEKPVYADYRAWFGHFWRHGRNVLIEIILDLGILQNPYIEPTFILADKLVQVSKIEEYEEQ